MKDDYTISHEKPEIYEKLHELFGVEWDNGLIITYGNVIHCKYPISDELLAHEETHVMQQEKYGRDKWWSEYILNPRFRLIEETAAYLNQVRWMRENRNRDYRRKRIPELASDMARMYGGMCTYEQALAILKE